jgi:hypothetical protein
MSLIGQSNGCRQYGAFAGQRIGTAINISG